jgi:GNAT superfamily N-acetyltransferase
VEYRRAVEADLAGEYDVFMAAMKELHERRGDDWPDPVPLDLGGRWAAIHRHLLAHDGERCHVAEEDGRVVGFTAALVRDGVWFFSALFIDPAYQGRGVGRELLARAWQGPYRRRITITEAIQPVSTGLYSKHGLLPVAPIIVFRGTPSIAPVDGLEAGACDDGEALRAIDEAAYGFDRAVDHQLWGSLALAAHTWRRDGRAVAYSYADANLVGPIAGVDPDSAAEALQCALAGCGDRAVTLAIPGSAPRLIEVALASGLQYSDPGLLLVSPADDPLPASLAIHSYWLL